MVAKSVYFMRVNVIRSFSFDERVEDVTTAPEGATKYVIVHIGVTEFADATRLIIMPDTSEDLYWQDVGRASSETTYTDGGDGRVIVNISQVMFSISLSVE